MDIGRYNDIQSRCDARWMLQSVYNGSLALSMGIYNQQTNKNPRKYGGNYGKPSNLVHGHGQIQL